MVLVLLVSLSENNSLFKENIRSNLYAMDRVDHIAHVFGMEEIVGHILKFLPMKELHRVAR